MTLLWLSYVRFLGNTLWHGDLCTRNLLGSVEWDWQLWKEGRKEAVLGSSKIGLRWSPGELWSEILSQKCQICIPPCWPLLEKVSDLGLDDIFWLKAMTREWLSWELLLPTLPAPGGVSASVLKRESGWHTMALTISVPTGLGYWLVNLKTQVKRRIIKNNTYIHKYFVST